MTTTRQAYDRRRFLGTLTASVLSCGMSPWLAAGADNLRRRKLILSFYCDDASPYTTGAVAFRTFLDFCAEQHIAGESSCILGMNGHSMARKPNDEEQLFLGQVKRAWGCGIDTHMELMTHRGLFDFKENREPEGAAHEGVWLYEPAATVEQYERYLGSILAEGLKAEAKFTGLTWPGCGCKTCQQRYSDLRAAGHKKPNPALWQALLNLAKQGRFRGRTVPCFFDSSETDFGLHRKASDGQHAVFDLMPNAMDHFGIWENNPEKVNPDYYISTDGKSGIIVRHLEANSPYCIWYSHWQGLNPAKGAGWRAFTTIVERIRKHLADQVVWMRPSDITNRFQERSGWDFVESL